MERAQPLKLFGHTILPGTRQQLNIPVVRLYTDTPIDLRIEVIHGRKKGPCLLVTAAIHGDELNGVEICRQILGHKSLSKIHGTLIVIPVVNQLGFIQQIRYLPDRRDLNRCFPGSSKGSLGGRLANLITTGIFPHVDYALDLHTGAIHRTNLPQLRTDLTNGKCLGLARAFGAPVILHSSLRDGSFRHAANEYNIPALVYEAGEALRLEQASIKLGFKGVMRVMRHLHMLAGKPAKASAIQPWECNQSQWLRSSRDGLVLLHTKQGHLVKEGDTMMTIVNPFDANDSESITAPFDGVVIGLSQLPLANEGDALVHLAKVSSTLADTEYDQEVIEEVLDLGVSQLPVPENHD
ncbi:succinylglutamate desuccinylase/aspartoacylase family protein [Endozoicomonas sp. YOMI1]|uniref:succinylglutamate desuccinylase/aspartoacylase family protein n=1 Tax=Endozoicomonas sp. YOMI1 TaxID=2828739 RepID=UPI002148BFC0|nr:succinylglutamate desuccinylase/aspartoacylase family protein [Endozoicomonas sp. YOMI1]